MSTDRYSHLCSLQRELVEVIEQELDTEKTAVTYQLNTRRKGLVKARFSVFVSFKGKPDIKKLNRLLKRKYIIERAYNGYTIKYNINPHKYVEG